MRWVRPLIELQSSSADGGYACASAIFALYGISVTVRQIQSMSGHASRGLTPDQLRDLLISLGATAVDVQFDKKRAADYPTPGIILLQRGHFAVVSRKGEDWLEVFDPRHGWSRIKAGKLARSAIGTGIHVVAMAREKMPRASSTLSALSALKQSPLIQVFFREAASKLGIRVLAISLMSQLAALAIPLVSMRSVDFFHVGGHAGLIGTLALAFVLISVTSTVTGIVASLLRRQLSKRMFITMGGALFDRLASRPASWFENNSPSSISNLVNSVDSQLRQLSDMFVSCSGVLVTLCVGVFALFFISPWLAVPGFLSLGISIALGTAFGRTEAEVSSLNLDALRRRQAFVIETISQIPLFVRFGSAWQGRMRYKQIVRRVAEAQARTSHIQNQRTAITTIVKSLEGISFVSLVAFFIGKDHFTLGAFVAVGSYKDLLAQSLSSLFQYGRQYKVLKMHRLLTHEIMNAAPAAYDGGRSLRVGRLSLRNVTFSYGELDRPVLTGASLDAEPAEFVVLAGPSGAGKSTIAKLICGLAPPQTGEVLVDGEPPRLPMHGFGAVLQSDRLISGTIRENISLFRKNISDDEIYTALEMATIKDFVWALPLRLETKIAEGLAGLSGGQRQRLLLARALIGNPKLLLLDEATSSVEVAGERQIFQNLVATGATLIVIAHRPEVWRFATRIYHVADGRVELR
ncbi:MAG: ATP-binding cassette domain-containing protein [Rhizomicrobium sp.]